MNQTSDANNQSIKLQLLNRFWEFKCLPAETAKLQEAALFLDQKMQSLLQEGKAVGYEQLTLLAAMALSHELIAEKNKIKRITHISKKIRKLRNDLNDQLTIVSDRW